MNALNTYNFIFRPSFCLYLVSTSWIAPLKINIVHRTQKQETQNTKVKSQNTEIKTT